VRQHRQLIEVADPAAERGRDVEAWIPVDRVAPRPDRRRAQDRIVEGQREAGDQAVELEQPHPRDREQPAVDLDLAAEQEPAGAGLLTAWHARHARHRQAALDRDDRVEIGERGPTQARVWVELDDHRLASCGSISLVSIISMIRGPRSWPRIAAAMVSTRWLSACSAGSG